MQRTVYNLANLSLSLSTDSISTLNSHDSSSDYFGGEHQTRSATSSFLSTASIDSYSSQHAANFDHDATGSIYDSLVQNHDPANIQLELTALRMSTNASDHQVRRAIVLAFVKRIVQLITGGTSAKEAVAQVFGKYGDLVERSVFDKGKSKKVDQVDFMVLLQGELKGRENGDVILLVAATKLVELELVEEEGMVEWWEDAKSKEGEEMERVRGKTGQLVEYLMESEEESSEGSDEEEEESEDE
jgi:translation initiation factor eIF-2B subunit epsilon